MSITGQLKAPCDHLTVTMRDFSFATQKKERKRTTVYTALRDMCSSLGSICSSHARSNHMIFQGLDAVFNAGETTLIIGAHSFTTCSMLGWVLCSIFGAHLTHSCILVVIVSVVPENPSLRILLNHQSTSLIHPFLS